MLKSSVKILAGFAMTGLFGACVAPKPAAISGDGVAVVETPTQTEQIIHDFPSPMPHGERTVEDVLQAYGPYASLKLAPDFAEAGVSFPPREIVFIALKQEMKLELWARDNDELRLIHIYDIQAASGVAGPKLRQGDRQVPEGVYRIVGLNPNSNYHLSMKLNYPNEFDLYHAWQEGRNNPGSDIFIHGKADSIGCLAMGDEAIEELFVLTALAGADNVKVVIAPHDPRLRPLESDLEELPAWTSELYSIISREIKALPPVVKSVQTGF